jgi:hypothetical protein
MKRFILLAISLLSVAAGGVVLFAGGAAARNAAEASNGLPTLTLALNGKSVTLGGSTVSGAVNVVTTVTAEKQGEPTLFRLNPGVPFSDFGAAVAQANKHQGDLNYLDPYGGIVFDVDVNRGTTSDETDLAPGNYFAIDTESGGSHPPFAAFTVTQSSAPAALPSPGATISAIEFGFKGPGTLHDGELVRFENAGFLVHMIVGLGVKNAAAAHQLVDLLRAGKDNKATKLVTSEPTWGAGPLSSLGMQQEVIAGKPGYYVLACFMSTQDGREHTRLGMERIIRIVK